MSNQLLKYDIDSLAGVLERKFPDLQSVRPLSVLGSGFRSIAFETAGGDVIRVGLVADAADDYAKEWRIGRFLNSQRGAIVPEPRCYAQPCDELPHGALGYTKLPGATPMWAVDPGAAFAKDLGAFMARLHQLPVDAAREAGVPEVDSCRRLLEARDVVMPLLTEQLPRETLARIEDWWVAFAADRRMHPARTAVCHPDLWHDNLLRSESGRLSGVLDIGSIELGDSAQDFAAPSYFGASFMGKLIDAYRSAGGRFDADDEHRAERFHEAWEFGGLAWAVEHNDTEEIEESIEKVLRGPIFA